MKKLNLLFFSLLLLASCTVQEPLYHWGDYETTSYNYLKKSTEESTQKLIEDFQKIIEDKKGSSGKVPPGIYADYGFVLLQANKTAEGKEMLLTEVALYPESKIFIDRILKMIE